MPGLQECSCKRRKMEQKSLAKMLRGVAWDFLCLRFSNGVLINLNSRLNKSGPVAESRTRIATEIKRLLLTLWRRSRSLPQIVNRNLIGRFTIFAEIRTRSVALLVLFRVFLPHARTGRFQGTHVVYVRSSSVVCQPLNTGHPRSSPIFSPIHLAADSATLLINETSHIYPALGQRGFFLSPRIVHYGFALLHSCFTAYCEPIAGAFSTSRNRNRYGRDGCMDFRRHESLEHRYPRYLANAPIGHR